MIRYTLAALCTLVCVAACSPAAGNEVQRTLLANLPMDSVVQSLGAALGSRGITVSGGQAFHRADGRFEQTFVLDFGGVGPEDDRVLTLLTETIRDFAVARGVPFLGRGGAAGSVETLSYKNDSLVGWVGIVAAKSRFPGRERYVVIVQETHRPPR
jgi:hypothetical protein